MPWKANMALADCGARVLAQQRPANGGHRVLRENAVNSLRFLWKAGDADARRTIAARVLAWLEIPEERRERVWVRMSHGGAQ